MMIEVLKSKIHRVRVTQANLNYVGSITIDEDLLDAANMIEGEKVQISLKDADVGAIYLGKADTEFSMKNDTDHATNGIVRSTGIFLKESGGAGTVQHIDLAV